MKEPDEAAVSLRATMGVRSGHDVGTGSSRHHNDGGFVPANPMRVSIAHAPPNTRCTRRQILRHPESPLVNAIR